MSQLDQFISDAIKTESKIDTVKVNSELLLNKVWLIFPV